MIRVTNMRYYDSIKLYLWLLIGKAPKDSSKVSFTLTNLKFSKIKDMAYTIFSSAPSNHQLCGIITPASEFGMHYEI